MKQTLYILLLFVSISACNNNTETEYKEVTAIRASDLYLGDTVHSYMQRNKDIYASIADSYLKRSAEAAHSNLDKAVYCCKRAATLHPTLETYQTLAGLLNQIKAYKELTDLYRLIVGKWYTNGPDNDNEYVFKQPDVATYSDYLVAQLLSSGGIYPEDIYEAEQSKIDMAQLKEHVFSDPRLKGKIDMTTPAAKAMMLYFLSDKERAAYNELPSTYKDFLASIKDASPVFEIDKESVHDFAYRKFMGDSEEEISDVINLSKPEPKTESSYMYKSFLKEQRENPEGWFVYNFNHVIAINDSVNAVVYAIDSSETACPVEMRHIYHRLVTYNKKAKIIMSQIVAIQSGEKLLTASFNFDKFTTTEYHRNWKKPYDKKDFDNYLLSTDKLKETSYHITPQGKIEQLD